ncbi:hypothetical protein L0Y59_03865, partial [Candidatus Uhrbacteria bacterium]|nr:hypothetical protein [Candidatus Uhrbacteria bacterium]
VILKNDAPVNLLLHLPWWLPYEIGKAVASLFSWSSLKGEAASIAGIPKMLRKRKELAGKVKASAAGIRKWMA